MQGKLLTFYAISLMPFYTLRMQSSWQAIAIKRSTWQPETQGNTKIIFFNSLFLRFNFIKCKYEQKYPYIITVMALFYSYTKSRASYRGSQCYYSFALETYTLAYSDISTMAGMRKGNFFLDSQMLLPIEQRQAFEQILIIGSIVEHDGFFPGISYCSNQKSFREEIH